MPSDPFSAVVYVFLLIPGLVYVSLRENHRPKPKQSVFRETATVIFASALSLLATTVLSLFIALFVNEARSGFAALIASPDQVRQLHPIKFFTLWLLFLLIATVFAYGAAHPAAQALFARMRLNKGRVDISSSGWSAAFNALPGMLVIVSIQFNNGDWMQGPLYTFTPGAEDTMDRSLSLYGEIIFRGKDSETAEPLAGKQMIVVQASEIHFLSVVFESPEDTEERLTHHRR